MTAKEIIVEAMKTREYNQTILAKEAGLKRQSNVSEMLRGKSMRVDNFVLLLDTMNFDIVIKDRNGANNTKWVLENPAEEEPK
jgi:hypothetical protein